MMRTPAVLSGRRAALSGLLFLLSSLAPVSSVHAQVEPGGPALLSLLPPGGRVLTRGAERTGRLGDEGAHLLPDGRRVIGWALTGERGETVTIDLSSTDFDAMLYLVAPDGRESWNDDDSGGGCDARIQLSLPQAGRYLVVASGLDAAADGAYRLMARTGAEHAVTGSGSCGAGADGAESWEMPAPHGTITAGQTVTGTLDENAAVARDGTWMHVYELRGLGAGEQVWIHLRSDAFDAFAEARTPTSTGLSDDDSGGGCNALLAWTLPAEGPYYVLANTVSAGQAGAYELAVTRTRPDVSTGGCMGDGTEPRWEGASLGSLSAGDTRTGSLQPGADAAGHQIWEVRGAAGASITVDLGSDSFDTLLVLVNADGSAISSDDDGGGRCDSRLTFTIPSEGVARVVATSLEPSGAGTYTLRASAEPGPRRDGDCTAG